MKWHLELKVDILNYILKEKLCQYLKQLRSIKKEEQI